MAPQKRSYSDIMDSPPLPSVRCFCCLDLYPISTTHGIHDEAIIQFAIHMTQLVSYPMAPEYSRKDITNFLKNAMYLVKYQKCIYGEISETRYFMPLPTEEKFMEIEEEMIRASEKEEKWRDSMRYLKLRCDRHEGPIFICKIVQREESPKFPMAKEVPAVKSIDLEDTIF